MRPKPGVDGLTDYFFRVQDAEGNGNANGSSVNTTDSQQVLLSHHLVMVLGHAFEDSGYDFMLSA